VGLADTTQVSPGATGAETSTFTPAGSLAEVLVALRQPPNAVWLNHDQRGSTVALTDVLGELAAPPYQYDSYGNTAARNVAPRSAVEDVTTPFLFTGQYRDAETGFYYLRSRYYDPTTGQFLSRDPMVAMTLSPYAYTAGNPLNSTDPSGLIDPSLLSQGQISQINQECSRWRNQSLCTQAAFCAEWTEVSAPTAAVTAGGSLISRQTTTPSWKRVSPRQDPAPMSN